MKATSLYQCLNKCMLQITLWKLSPCCTELFIPFSINLFLHSLVSLVKVIHQTRSFRDEEDFRQKRKSEHCFHNTKLRPWKTNSRSIATSRRVNVLNSPHSWTLQKHKLKHGSKTDEPSGKKNWRAKDLKHAQRDKEPCQRKALHILNCAWSEFDLCLFHCLILKKTEKKAILFKFGACQTAHARRTIGGQILIKRDRPWSYYLLTNRKFPK